MTVEIEKIKDDIAVFLKNAMKSKGIENKDLLFFGINKQQLYSVLRIGKILRPNYSIETLIKIFIIIYENKNTGTFRKKRIANKVEFAKWIFSKRESKN